jgi:hypothetical protein
MLNQMPRRVSRIHPLHYCLLTLSNISSRSMVPRSARDTEMNKES